LIKKGACHHRTRAFAIPEANIATFISIFLVGRLLIAFFDDFRSSLVLAVAT
jgi:hypothetical protein